MWRLFGDKFLHFVIAEEYVDASNTLTKGACTQDQFGEPTVEGDGEICARCAELHEPPQKIIEGDLVVPELVEPELVESEIDERDVL